MNTEEIQEALKRLAAAPIPSRHVKNRPLTKQRNGPSHPHIPWDVVAAALNHYLTPAHWSFVAGREFNGNQEIINICGRLVINDEDGNTITFREAWGSAKLNEDIDAAGQATANALRRCATLLGYNLIAKPVCDNECCMDQ